MEPDREETRAARRALEEGGGLVLRATRRGALVLETENARRMMRRLQQLRAVSADAEPERGAGAAAART